MKMKITVEERVQSVYYIFFKIIMHLRFTILLRYYFKHVQLCVSFYKNKDIGSPIDFLTDALSISVIPALCLPCLGRLMSNVDISSCV